ncbi:MAG: DUF192 domain-containing protein [Alphaproteobacteria bacterium]
MTVIRAQMARWLAAAAFLFLAAPVLAGERLAIESGTARHVFSVEVARTLDSQARGLMFRRRLAPDAGMLFLYEPPRPIVMWMRNTFIPLDMIFFAADGRITRIVERAVPRSEARIPSGGPVRGVLEVNAGTAARLGIAPGDRLRHPAVETARRIRPEAR